MDPRTWRPGSLPTRTWWAHAEVMILVGVDGSPASRKALRWALDEATRTGTTVEATMAWRRQPSVVPAPSMGVHPYADVPRRRHPGQELHAIVEEARADVRQPRRSWRSPRPTGPPTPSPRVPGTRTCSWSAHAAPARRRMVSGAAAPRARPLRRAPGTPSVRRGTPAACRPRPLRSAVRARRPGRRAGRCPHHPDRSPRAARTGVGHHADEQFPPALGHRLDEHAGPHASSSGHLSSAAAPRGAGAPSRRRTAAR